METEKFHSPRTIADILEVTPATVREWIRDGKLVAIKLPTGVLRVSNTELVRFINERHGS